MPESLSAKTVIEFTMGERTLNKLLEKKPVQLQAKDDTIIIITLDQETEHRLNGLGVSTVVKEPTLVKELLEKPS